MYTDILCRYAIMCNMLVISVGYRLAPEAQAPNGIRDAVAAVKMVIKEKNDFKIDTSRIAIGGDEAGAYIAANVSMWLFEMEEAHIVKF